MTVAMTAVISSLWVRASSLVAMHLRQPNLGQTCPVDVRVSDVPLVAAHSGA